VTTVRRLVAPLLAVAVVLPGSGCMAVSNLVLPVSEEQDLGREMEAELAKQLPLIEDPQVVDYVRGLGERIVAAAADDTPEGILFEFHVVDDDSTVNAFAIPGGKIYIYTGLLKLVEDESELVGVMGHEVAHVTQRHIARQLTARYGLQLLSALTAGLVPGPLGITSLAASVVTQGTLLKYSRGSEEDADHVGLAYVFEAGWDPRGMLRFFEKMATLSGDPGIGVLLQTHPASGERRLRAHERIADFGRLPTETGRERYQAFLQRLGGPRREVQAK
jgi:predicted Zn-dependent protease